MIEKIFNIEYVFSTVFVVLKKKCWRDRAHMSIIIPSTRVLTFCSNFIL